MSEGSLPGQSAGAFDAPRAKRWRPRRLHLHLSLWSLVAGLILAVVLGLSSMALTGRVIALPAWVTDRVTDELNAAMPAGRVSLRRVEAGVTPAGRPKLRLVGVGLSDASGLKLADLNAVEMSLSRRAAISGQIVPSHVALQGAQLTLRRLRDGGFDVAFGQSAGTSGDFANLLDAVDALFEGGPIAQAAWVGASDLTVTLEDARSGRIWQVTDGAVEITPQERFVDTSVRFDVFNQTDALAAIDFGFRSARDSSEASVSLRFDNAAARDIAAQSPVMSALSVIDAPMSGALRASFNTDGGLTELAGALKLGAGSLSPDPGAKPAQFDGARIYIDFDPARQRIAFTGAELKSEMGAISAEGHVDLADFRGGWPNSLVGQIDIPEATLAPAGVFAAPVRIDSATTDLRVQLDPFRVDFGQIVADRGPHSYRASGALGANADGWWVSLDAETDRASRDEALALWPVVVEPGSRQWVSEFIEEGSVVGATLAFRKDHDTDLQMSGTLGLTDVRLASIEGLPPLDGELGYVSITPQAVVVVAEKASLKAPNGTPIDASGTSYVIPVYAPGEAPPVPEATLNLALATPIRGALSVLADPPFNIFDAAGDLGPDLARGTAQVTGRVQVPMDGSAAGPDAFRYDIAARLTDVSSDVLIPGKLLTGDTLDLHASNTGVEVSGPVKIGRAEANGTWMLPMVGTAAMPASLSGTLAITPAALSEFGLDDVAGMVSGATRARFDIDLGTDGQPPILKLSSDLGGLGLEIPGTGWSKPRKDTGTLALSVVLGDRPEVTALQIKAPGLEAGGTVTTIEGGGLGEALFDRVRLGAWLDAPVQIRGQGPGQPVAITVPSGVVDLRQTAFQDDNSATSATPGGPGPRQPLTLNLDRLILTDNIQLTSVQANLDLSGGIAGSFTGSFLDGNLVKGTVATTEAGPAVRLTSNRAGEVLRQTGIFAKANGGTLNLVLAPLPGVGSYEGEFEVTETRVVDAPAVAELLSAVSLVGLPDALQGEGIRFNKVAGRFRLDPTAVTLYRASAVGPSMGLSLDGYYDMASDQIDMQGVLSPIYIVNALGRALSVRDGEGLVGFNFNLKGAAQSPDVRVNPLSILAPGAFREIFRRAPPRPGQPTPTE